MKKRKKTKPFRPAPAASTVALALPYAKVVGRPGSGSYPAPSPDPATHDKFNDASAVVYMIYRKKGLFDPQLLQYLQIIPKTFCSTYRDPVAQ